MIEHKRGKVLEFTSCHVWNTASSFPLFSTQLPPNPASSVSSPFQRSPLLLSGEDSWSHLALLQLPKPPTFCLSPSWSVCSRFPPAALSLLRSLLRFLMQHCSLFPAPLPASQPGQLGQGRRQPLAPRHTTASLALCVPQFQGKRGAPVPYRRQRLCWLVGLLYMQCLQQC